jgi:cell division protein FtsW
VLILFGNTNLGTAMVIGFIGMAAYGVSAVTKYHKTGFLILLCLMVVGGLIFGLRERYRMDRIAVWTHYWQTNNSVMLDKDCPNRRGCSDQFDQGLVVLGSGGLTGVGLGQSIGKYNFYHTSAGDDSVIDIMAEEYGFIVTAAILLLYFYLVFRCITVAKSFSDRPIYFFLMIGTSSWIGIQAFIHVGANIGIVPLTGQTLPFISLGGSSLISLMCAMGLILNVSKQKDYKLKEDSQAFVPTRTVKQMPRAAFQ